MFNLFRLCHRSNIQLQTQQHGRSVCVSASLLVTFASPAKTAEPIKIPFYGLTPVGLRNHVSDGDPDRPLEWGFWGLSGQLKSIGITTPTFPHQEKFNNCDSGTAAAGGKASRGRCHIKFSPT